jgi:hypothetical protein
MLSSRVPWPNGVTKTTSASRPPKSTVKEARSGQDLQTAVNQFFLVDCEMKQLVWLQTM